jgi:hypothetical protein
LPEDALGRCIRIKVKNNKEIQSFKLSITGRVSSDQLFPQWSASAPGVQTRNDACRFLVAGTQDPVRPHGDMLSEPVLYLIHIQRW